MLNHQWSRIDIVTILLLSISLAMPWINGSLSLQSIVFRAAVFAIATVGVYRRTKWGKFIASLLLVLCALLWVVLSTPLGVEHEQSFLEPLFGTPLPTLVYVLSIVGGLMIFLVPLWILSNQTTEFKRRVW